MLFTRASPFFFCWSNSYIRWWAESVLWPPQVAEWFAVPSGARGPEPAPGTEPWLTLPVLGYGLWDAASTAHCSPTQAKKVRNIIETRRYCLSSVQCFRIRIHFIRIRIQHFRLRSGSSVLMTKNWKNLWLKIFFYIFGIISYNLPISRPP